MVRPNIHGGRNSTLQCKSDILHASGEQVTEANVTSTTFTASYLSEFVILIEATTWLQTSISPGIAYDVSVSAVNFAGFGGSKNITYFAKELGMCDQYSQGSI